MNYNEFFNFETVRDSVFFRVVNYERNQEILKGAPYLRLNDLAITFRWLAAMDQERIASALVQNEHLKRWNISLETLVGYANENTPVLFPARLVPMNQMIEHCMELADEEEIGVLQETMDTSMMVLTNHMGMNGAGCMCYKGLLAQVADKIENNFYILPSSVHEVIILPEAEELDADSLERMVCSVNEELVADEEILSNHVYYYHKEKKSLTIA